MSERNTEPPRKRIALEEARLPQKILDREDIAKADNRRIVSPGEERLTGTDRMMCAMHCPWRYAVEERAAVDDIPVAPEGLNAFSGDSALRVVNIG